MKPKKDLITHLGIVVAGVFVVGAWLIVTSAPKNETRKTEKTIRWEHLKGEEGSDLQRLRLPYGWLVENEDGVLTEVSDPEHRWLDDQDE